MSEISTNVPNSISKLFINGHACYEYIDRDREMDNAEAMAFFLDEVGATDEHIKSDGGTQVSLVHPDFDYLLEISSEGMGDFFSHGFNVTKYDNPEPLAPNPSQTDQ